MKIYNQLAWTDYLLAGPANYEEEASLQCELLKSKITTASPTMLHLGCGAGGHDFYFKRHFVVTGVDLSEDMLARARVINPEITYLVGDMRTVSLDLQFDCVAIPDSIIYMNTLEDLKAAFGKAVAHLKSHGTLFIVVHTKEEFTNNNFAYVGADENVHVTVLENNHIISESTYEAVFTYLIRSEGVLRIEHDVHTLGIFSYAQWMQLFADHHLQVTEVSMNHLYDNNLLGEGEYKLKAFLATKVA